MPSTNKDVRLTVEEYLSREESAAVKNEYVNGTLFAMTGASLRHNLIAGNIYSLLRNHVGNSPCRVYIGDVKVKVEKANSFYYPDVMVACHPYTKNSVFISHPILIIEVISPSTAAIDRREKVIAYTQIDSLTEYLIIQQRRKRVQLHRRNAQGTWDIFEFGAGEEISLESIPSGTLIISVDAIYKDIDYPGTDDGNLLVKEDTEFGWEEVDEDDES